MKLPEGVLRDLVRSVGAYLQAAPVSELPGSIRRYRNFRTASLWPQRDRLMRTLEEDEDLRGAILVWLEEEKPRLSPESERRLRLFLERPEAWEEALVSSNAAKTQGASAEATSAGAVPGRDHKAEARRVREQMRDMARTHDSATAAQNRQITELEARLKAAEAAAEAASENAAGAAQDHERRLRRLQRALQQATAERDRARSEVKALRRELRQQARRADAAEEAPAGAASRASGEERGAGGESPAAPGPRRPLPVPPGLLEDDPATLARWLQEPGVRLLVDGYNVAKQDGAFKALSGEDQRARTVDEVTRLVRRHGVEATVVFDGADVAPGTSRRRRGPVKVEYSRPPENGDDHLVAVLASWPAAPVVVATSDKELQERCRVLGSTIATSEQLLAAVR